MNKHDTLASAFSRLRNGLDKVASSIEQDESYTLKAARSDIAHYIACCVADGEETKLNVGLAVIYAQDAKGKSRTGLVKACDAVVRELDGLIAQQWERSAALKQDFYAANDYCARRELVEEAHEEASKMNAEIDLVRSVEAMTYEEAVGPEYIEQAFVNRCVMALDASMTDTHNVYIHWHRIGYGHWVDAVEVVEAGGLSDYLEAIGLNESDVAELMTQDWDCQDAEGLSLKCLGNYGSFDWKLMGELLEAAVECGEDVVDAALSAGIPATEVGDKYLGQWESMEDYAYDHWESCGLLESIPESARGYLDWQAIARDIRFNGDVCESNGHYFCA